MIKFSTGHLFVYLSIFCYLSFLPIFKTDVQPYFILAGLVFLLSIKPLKLPSEFVYIIISVFTAFIILLLDFIIYDFFEFTKSIQKFSKYVVFLISSICFYEYLKLYGFPLKHIKVFCYTSLAVGLIQLLYNERFFEFFLYRIATDDSRGVTSVMSEPTHFGMYCLFLMFILKIYKYPKKDLYLILIFNIVILSQSTQTILFLIIWGILFLFSKNYFYKILLFITSFVLTFYYKAFFYFLNELFDNRFTSILTKIDINDIVNLLLIDESISGRVSHVILSIYWFFSSFLFPNLYNNWVFYVNSYNNEILNFSFIGNGVIISTLGSILFEIGFFCISYDLFIL